MRYRDLVWLQRFKFVTYRIEVVREEFPDLEVRLPGEQRADIKWFRTLLRTVINHILEEISVSVVRQQSVFLTRDIFDLSP